MYTLNYQEVCNGLFILESTQTSFSFLRDEVVIHRIQVFVLRFAARLMTRSRLMSICAGRSRATIKWRVDFSCWSLFNANTCSLFVERYSSGEDFEKHSPSNLCLRCHLHDRLRICASVLNYSAASMFRGAYRWSPQWFNALRYHKLARVY
jgi:uncharacterized protein YerC